MTWLFLTNPVPRARLPMIRALAVLLLACGMAACGPGTDRDGTAATPSSPSSIADVLRDDPRFSTLATALDSAGLMQTLHDSGPYTVFAPTDTAFGALPNGTVQDLLLPQNRDRLVTILNYHVAEGTHSVSAMRDTSVLRTIEGRNLPIGMSDGATTVATGTVIMPNIGAGNGVIHAVDAVFLPPSQTEAM